MAPSKKVVAEEDVIGAVTMTLKKKNTGTLDRLKGQLGVSSRSAAGSRLLDAVENMLQSGKLTPEMILIESLPKT